MSFFLKSVVPVLIAIGFFELIIFVHEFGHFITAKLCGVQVNEFALGMGPALIKFRRGETQYSFRLFPIGGYCAMEGEDEDSDNERAFNKKAPWKRLIIVVAGAVMNLLLGLVILFCLISSKSYVIGDPVIAEFRAEDSMSHQTGLETGDRIKSVNGMRIYIDDDIFMAMAMDDDGVMDFVVERDGEYVTLHDVTFDTEEAADGRVTIKYDFLIKGVKKTPWRVIKHSVGKAVSIGRMVVISIADLISGKYRMTDLSGPIGTVAIISQSVSVSYSTLLFMMAFITINIGIFNLLPIPALDGSKGVFILIEMIFRKKLPRKWETIITTVGFALLLALVLFVSINDIIHIDRYKL